MKLVRLLPNGMALYYDPAPLRNPHLHEQMWSQGVKDGKTLRNNRKWKIRMTIRQAKFGIGQIVKHRVHPFRGVIFDVDPEFSNTEEWWQSIPAQTRPKKEQPYYHLLAENAETTYIAYVSEQNLLGRRKYFLAVPLDRLQPASLNLPGQTPVLCPTYSGCTQVE